MSHFATIVLVEPKDAKKDIEEKVASLLHKYDENIEVEEYDKDCYCIGAVARKHAREVAGKETGTIDELRESFRNREPGTSNDDWREHIAEHNRIEKEAFDVHEMKNKPDPECGFYTEDFHPDGHEVGERFSDESGCGGTGTYRSTYNPISKWDWYSIGGRWTGLLDNEFSPKDNPENLRECKSCNGTGKIKERDVTKLKTLKVKTKIEYKERDCKRCEGKGESLVWPTSYAKFDGDIKPVTDFPEDTSPYAIVLPDGTWLEKGEMGWFGMSSNEKSDDDWDTVVKEVWQEYGDCIGVVVDCHI